jgi:hypothetical protein
LFGPKQHLASNYLFYDGGCGCIGTIILANVLPSIIYHAAEATSNSTSPGAATRYGVNDGLAPSNSTSVHCVGPACFRTTHEIIIGLCGVGVAASVVLAFRSRALYRTIGGGA